MKLSQSLRQGIEPYITSDSRNISFLGRIHDFVGARKSRSPANASRSVDLPQPEGPIIAKTLPGLAQPARPWRMGLLPPFLLETVTHRSSHVKKIPPSSLGFGLGTVSTSRGLLVMGLWVCKEAESWHISKPLTLLGCTAEAMVIKERWLEQVLVIFLCQSHEVRLSPYY